MYLRLTSRLVRFIHCLMLAGIGHHQALTIKSGWHMWKVPRFMGCTCGRIFYTDVYTDRSVTEHVQRAIDTRGASIVTDRLGV